MILLFCIFAEAFATSFDDIKDYKCFNFPSKESKRTLTCITYVGEKNCSDYCSNSKTTALEVGWHELFQMKTSNRLCQVSYFGQCGNKISKEADDLCFEIVEDELNYNAAIADCKSRGSELYVPDNDVDLGRLIQLTKGKITEFWMGGGTIFWRKCEKAPANSEGVEVAILYTVKKQQGSIGYAMTKLATEQHSYICAIQQKKNSQDACLSFSTLPGGSANSNSPYAIRKTIVENGYQIQNWFLATIPGGPLSPQDSLSFTAMIGTEFSMNFLSSQYSVGMHFKATPTTNTCVFSSMIAGSKWGGSWNSVGGLSIPNCGLKMGYSQKFMFLNDDNAIVVNIDGIRSYTWIKPNNNVDYEYTYLVFQVVPNTISAVSATTKGITRQMPFSSATRYIKY